MTSVSVKHSDEAMKQTHTSSFGVIILSYPFMKATRIASEQ